MRILFLLSHPIFPPDTGALSWVFHILSFLTREHDCDVLQFVEPGAAAVRDFLQIESVLPRVKVLGTLRQNSGRRLHLERLRCLATGQPTAGARYRRADVYALLESISLERYDIVCFFLHPLAQYQPLFASRPTVLLAVDAYSLGILNAMVADPSPFARARALAEMLLMARDERRSYPRFDRVLVVAERDAHWLRRLSRNIVADVVPVAVDDDLLAPRQPPVQAATPPRVLCWGLLSHSGNAVAVASFVTRAWPVIHAAVPEAELIVWSRTEPHVRLKRVLGGPGVKQLGYVDDWIRTLSEASVLVYPQRGGAGLQTKVQSAMALGVPAVVTPGIAGGLPIEPGVNSYVCESADEFAAACITLLQDPVKRAEMGELARSSIRANYAVDVVGKMVMKALEGAIERHADRHRSGPTNKQP